MNNHSEIEKQYYELFPDNLSFRQIAEKMFKFESHENIKDFRYMFANECVDTFTKSGIPFDDFKAQNGKLITEHFLKLNDNYFTSYANYLLGDKEKSLFYLKKCLNSINIEENVDWKWFGFYILPFGGAFPEFWTFLTDFMKQNSTEENTQLADILFTYNSAFDLDLMIDKCSKCLMSTPDNLLVCEIIGLSYYYKNNFRNAIPYLEMITEPFLLYLDDLYFDLGYMYSILKEYDKAIDYNIQCLEINPQRRYALNNLGITYMKKKNYSKAEEIFQKCIDEKIDLEYTAGNYINVLLALGKITEANKFLLNPPVKISNYFVDKVKNYKPKKNITSNEKIEEDISEISNSKFQSKAKSFQFSTEKMLEDELTTRLEKGESVFGLPLHIYNHKGDKYGRQYIIPVGRLDLLAEDNDGNLYIIELKKDSGYDDVYSQIRSYIDWFEKNKKRKGCKIYGIICLNSPDKALIEKVKSDCQVRLFEYAITYTEYK